MTIARVDIKPEMLRWAVARARLQEETLTDRIPQLSEWLAGEAKPTFKQLEKFAQATRVALGYLFLPTPPVEALPIPDFRMLAGTEWERRVAWPAIIDEWLSGWHRLRNECCVPCLARFGDKHAGRFTGVERVDTVTDEVSA
jgi:transcriptional regulator with XRE-family HTH domain